MSATSFSCFENKFLTLLTISQMYNKEETMQ